ncbi:MAG: 2Fe-2S iron-sulfur cluster-binding protein [Cyanobacteria bacterium]|nr:2Fe-2S iron-sulfur cluster-binding protein [Cyanobacteriota bacterium]
MAKTIRLEPIAQKSTIATNGNLLSALLNKDLDVLKECGGRGMCATCHIYVTEGMEALTPVNRREQRTLEVITSCNTNLQSSAPLGVLGEGIVVELPPGMYVNSLQDIEALIGRRAEQNLLHPITGAVLVEAGKLITRSTMMQLEKSGDNKFKINEFFNQSSEA